MALSVGEIEAVLKARDEMSAVLKKAEGNLTSLAQTLKGNSVLVDQYGNAISSTVPHVDKMAGKTDLLGAAVKTLGVYFTATKALQFGQELLDTASHVDDLSKKLDVSAETIQRWQFAGEQSGVTIDQIGNAVTFMSRKLAEGSDETRAMLDQLGISLDAARRSGNKQAFEDIGTAVASIADPMERARVQVELMGRAGADLLPLLRNNFKETADSAVVMSDRTVKSLDTLGDSLSRLWGNFKAVAGNQLAEGILEPFSPTRNEPALELLEDVTQQIKELTDAGPKLFASLRDAAKGLDAVGEAAERAKSIDAARKHLEAFDEQWAENDKRVAESIKTWEAYEARVKPIFDRLTGATTRRQINDTAEAIKRMLQAGKGISQGDLEDLVRQLDAWWRAGFKLPPVLEDIYHANFALTQSLPPLKRGIGDLIEHIPSLTVEWNRYRNVIADVAEHQKHLASVFEHGAGGVIGGFPSLMGPFEHWMDTNEEIAKQQQLIKNGIVDVVNEYSRLFEDVASHGSRAFQIVTRAAAEFSRSMADINASAAGFTSGAVGGAFVTMGTTLMYEYAQMRAAERLAQSQTVASQIDEINRLQQQLERRGVFARGVPQNQRDAAVWATELGFLTNIEGVMETLNMRMEHYQRLLNQVIGKEIKLAEVRERMTAELIGNFDELLAIGGQLPGSMQGAIDQLVTMGSISQETADILMGLDDGPDWEELQSMAQKYGVDIEHLGTAFQQLRVNDLGVELARAFTAMAQPGANIEGILRAMEDDVQAIIDAAELSGTSVPRSLEPIIRQMIALGLLTNAAGEALSMDDVEFNDTLEQSIQDLVDVIYDLLVALGLIPSKADAAARAIKDMWYAENPQDPKNPRMPTIQPPIPASAFETSGFSGGAAGGGGTVNVFVDASGAYFMDGASAKHIAEQLVPFLPPAVKAYGLPA